MPAHITGERLFAVLLVLIGTAAATRAFDYQVLVEDRVGPGFMPVLVGLGLAAVALPLTWQRSAPEGAAEEARERGDSTDPVSHDLKVWGSATKPVLVLIALGIAIVVSPLIGMFLALALFAFFVGAVLESLPVIKAAGLGLAVAVLIYLIFDRLLSVPLPGPWQ